MIVFFVRRGAAGAQLWRLLAAGAAGIALLGIAAYTVKDFHVLVGAGPEDALNWVLPAIIVVALLVGLSCGLVLRAKKPETHARIGLGNEAFQLERTAIAEQATRGGVPGLPRTRSRGVRAGRRAVSGPGNSDGTVTDGRDPWQDRADGVRIVG